MARSVFSAIFFLGLGLAIGIAGSFWLLQKSATEPSADMHPTAEQSSVSKPGSEPRELSAFEQLEEQISAAISTQDFALAIDLILDADLIASEAAEQDRLTQLLDEAVNLRVRQLNDRQLPGAIDELYERLSFAMPERAEFYILLAEHRIAMDNPQAALPVLAQIENHHQLGALARQLIDQIIASELPDESLAQIPLEQSGNQFIVAVSIDGDTTVDLLIDTGASMTTLSPDLLRDMGYDLNGPVVNFSTASGVIQAPVVEVGSVSLGAASVSGVVVGALPIARPNRPVDGLLGMNVLKHFEFTLDQEQRTLYLDSRSP